MLYDNIEKKIFFSKSHLIERKTKLKYEKYIPNLYKFNSTRPNIIQSQHDLREP